MKHPKLVVFLLVVIAVLTFSIQMCAKGHKAPSGKLMSYHFSRGGGMNPMDYTIFDLRYDDETGKALLTISGDCEGEEITVEVGDEVFEHCKELILKHKLYRSKGYYESDIQVLDAPSSSFSILFEEPYQDISGGGDMPDFLWEGISVIHSYFKSIVGDRKAEGHVDRIYGAEGVTGMHWTDGIHSYTTPKESVTVLKRAARGLTGDDETEPDGMGFSRFHDGDQHFVLIHDYQQHYTRLFYSFDGKDVSREQMVKRQMVAMLCGTYTDGSGRQYVFNVDGTCQGPNDTKPQPFIVFQNDNSPKPLYRWEGKTVDGFKLTADGADILGVTAKGGSKKVCHLKRVNGDNEKWPVVNERFLSQPMMDALSVEQLEVMLNCIRVRKDSPYNSMPWYTDIGGVNRELLESEILKRKKD